ncbi:MAG: exodeoxyribonuclease III [Methylococcaceae bacterium]|nr:exodeoxyribonuclease III [Methylococcaceae bacterium]
MRIISWNVNGIRAIQTKGFQTSFDRLRPDILCLQETRAAPDQVAEVLGCIDGYHLCANGASKKGYSGTAILSRIRPIDISHGIGIEEHDQEGRTLTAEFEDFFLVNVYVPNSGNELVRLDYRSQWDSDFRAFLKKLEGRKPVIACGDFNVAHQEIDIARPKANYNKTAGYTQVEIDGFSRLLESGFIDIFRTRYPDTVAYSWWSFRANARAKNIGWRIDYFVVSPSLTQRVKDAVILGEVMGSDHCPVGIEIES